MTGEKTSKRGEEKVTMDAKMKNRKLKAPFPYFGGKSRVASEVWKRFGAVKTYVEPFFGSGAVLLGRPGMPPFGREIVNDYDGHIANVWRSIRFAPDEVARWCDWPTNHIDLMARKAVINANSVSLRERLIADPEFCDPKLAGYWVWCASNWIGSGLDNPNSIPELTNSKGVMTQRPNINKPQGVMTAKECGVPFLDHNTGIMAAGDQVPKLIKAGGITQGGVHGWLRGLSERLRNVKVVCGDWTRVMGGNWRTASGVCAVFLDPPYGENACRTSRIYANDSLSVAGDVLAWCRENGGNQMYRIALCGYDGEHNELEKMGWDRYEWKAVGGYGNQGNKDSQGKKNRHREVIWFSPACINEPTLFDLIK